MRYISCLVAASCCGTLAACTSPGPEYHFTTEQLAWQPYQEGQVLRFGNDRTAAVRTYRVTQVFNVMVQQSGGWWGSYKEPPSFQTITALLQRTDSLSKKFEAFGLGFDFTNPPVAAGSQLLVNASLNWDTPNYTIAFLPVDELNQGLPLDTVRYGRVRLLPTRTLGSTAYASVVQYIPRLRSIGSVINPTTELYLTKTNGVVGFVQRNTLWYRIP